MDPKQNLRDQRELTQKILNDEGGDWTTEDAEQLAALALSMDDFRRSGGFDPYTADTTAPFRLQLKIDDGTEDGQWLTFFTGRTNLPDSMMASETAAAAAQAQAADEASP